MNSIDDITNFIFVEDAPIQADIIFLPGGSNPALPEKAAELYRAAYAPLLLPSGGYSVKLGKFSAVRVKADIYNKPYETECEFYTDVLTINGVPPEAIVQEDRSGHTRDNAFLSRKAADEKGLSISKAIICCKKFSCQALPDALPDGLSRSGYCRRAGGRERPHPAQLVQERARH